MEDYKQVCKKCGSENVLRMRWVNPNNNEVSSMTAGTEGLCEWCENCNEETRIIEDVDFVKPTED